MDNNTRYRKAVGGLLYITTLRRPYIASIVNILGRRNESPREADWEAIGKLIRYLITTKDLKFVIDKSKPQY